MYIYIYTHTHTHLVVGTSGGLLGGDWDAAAMVRVNPITWSQGAMRRYRRWYYRRRRYSRGIPKGVVEAAYRESTLTQMD